MAEENTKIKENFAEHTSTLSMGDHIVSEESLKPEKRHETVASPEPAPENPVSVKERAAIIKEVIREAEESQGIISASRSRQISKEREKKIEHILETGLDDIYLSMDSQLRLEFKTKGEETSRKINDMIASGKVKIKKIIELIKNWLKLIPGMNRFFIEQEAKIKADKIIQLESNAQV